ncbi:hypothetical protein HK405_002148, partial [Cladochytrium tenue]
MDEQQQRLRQRRSTRNAAGAADANVHADLAGEVSSPEAAGLPDSTSAPASPAPLSPKSPSKKKKKPTGTAAADADAPVTPVAPVAVDSDDKIAKAAADPRVSHGKKTGESSTSLAWLIPLVLTVLSLWTRLYKIGLADFV